MATETERKLGRTTTLHKTGSVERQWYIVDATDRPLGRLAADIATVLMGKHRPDYTPHVDTGDYVVVINANKTGLTGNKAEQNYRTKYTGYPGGLKTETMGWLRDHRPRRLVEGAVKRMLPKNRLGRVMITKLKVYDGADHPHAAHDPKPLP